MLAMPPCAGEAPEGREVRERALLDHRLLRARSGDVRPRVRIAIVRIDLDRLAAVEQIRVLSPQRMAGAQQRRGRCSLGEGVYVVLEGRFQNEQADFGRQG